MQKAYSTEYSQAVTHPSTNSALCCLTAVIGRELVLSTWYGRRCITSALIRVKLNVDSILTFCAQLDICVFANKTNANYKHHDCV